mmetsp:Transcript_14814/g.35319  ORF Transcript_14814/g.35319 Transcript_14814/m.35319 type:complete len:82 (+) Transcript_14814:154-399(+)
MERRPVCDGPTGEACISIHPSIHPSTHPHVACPSCIWAAAGYVNNWPEVSGHLSTFQLTARLSQDKQTRIATGSYLQGCNP